MLESGLNRLSKNSHWLYLLVLGIIIFFAQPILVTSDLNVYSCNALNIYLGKGYVDIDGSPVFFRAPLFSIMIAISYLLFGVSHVSTFWVIKAIGVLNPLIVYIIGKRFFDKRVGVSAALFILTSYAINFWSFRHLDAVWPFFILLSTLFFQIGFERNNYRHFVLGGISLALAYLVKEAAVLFFPLPFLMFLFVKDYRKNTFLTKIFSGYLAIFIFISPWLVYLFLKHPAPKLTLILGTGGSKMAYQLTAPSGTSNLGSLSILVLDKIKTLFAGFLFFWNGKASSLDQWFTFTPLFIISWCYVLFGAIRGNKHLRILSLHFLLYLPIMCLHGAKNMRPGQSILFYILSYLALSVLIDAVIKAASNKFDKIGAVIPGVFAALVACLILIQVFVSFRNDYGFKSFILKNQWGMMVFGDTYGSEPYGASTISNDKNVLSILNKFSSPPNNLYIVSKNRSLAKELYFNLKGKSSINDFESQKYNRITQIKQSKPKEQPIYFAVSKQTEGGRIKLKTWEKSEIHETIKKKKITHILVESFNSETGNARGLDRYFSTWQALKHIPLPLDEVSLYKVISKSKTPPSLPPIMDIESLKTLIELSSEKNSNNIKFLKKCFKTLYPSYQCPPGDSKLQDPADELEQNSLKASLLNKAGMNSLYKGHHENAMESFKQAICINPDFTEAYRNMFYANALMERQKAIALNPSNPVSYFHYGVFLEAYRFYETAIYNVQKAIHLNPNFAKAYATLGTIYAKQNKHDKAIDAFQKSLAIYKGFMGYRKDWMIYMNHRLIGDSYIRLGKLLKARQSYERAILTQSAPNTKIDAYFKLGALCKQLNDYPSAIENFQHAVHINSNLAKAYYHLSHSYLLNGDKNTAIKQYKKLKKLDRTLADKLNQESGWAIE